MRLKRQAKVEKKEFPEVVGCLIHNSRVAETVHIAREKKGPLAVRYGLCRECELAYQQDREKFAPYLDRMLCKRMRELEDLQKL
jgi:hypothetical protein